MIKKVILGIVIVIGAFILLVVLSMVALGFYSVHVNEKVDAAAKTFCNSIRVGSNIDTAVKTAERTSERNRLYITEGEYRFTFPGAIFHASACLVRTTEGKVVSTEIQVYDD